MSKIDCKDIISTPENQHFTLLIPHYTIIMVYNNQRFKYYDMLKKECWACRHFKYYKSANNVKTNYI